MKKYEVLLKIHQFSRPSAGNDINYESQLAISHGWSWDYCLGLTRSMTTTVFKELFWSVSGEIFSINILVLYKRGRHPAIYLYT